MRSFSRLAALGLMSAIGVVAVVSAAEAKCTRLAFSVNDYGKDGPTKDAKNLLDKYVAEWAKQRGITNYNIGKKTVNCELFIDVGLFDEHTCKAEASVCWGEGEDEKPAAEKTSDKPKKEKAAAKKKPEKKAEKKAE